MSVDQAIAAEEASLKAIEAYLKPHRETQPKSQPTVEVQSQPSPSKLDQSESPIRGARPSIFSQTPGKTPVREYPHISNSLVNPSPYRSTKINRFEPLKNIATPQKRERGSIFGMRAPRSIGIGGRTLMGQLQAVSPVKQSSSSARDQEVLVQEDDTIRLPVSRPEVVVPDTAPEEEEEDDGPTPQPSPTKVPSPPEGPKTVHGVMIDDEGVEAAIVCPPFQILHSLTPRQRSDQLTQTSWATLQAPKKQCKFSHHRRILSLTRTRLTISNHLNTLSDSTPDPIPSDQSSTSSALSTTQTPITKDQILHSSICLIVLRAKDLTVPMSELKETFSGMMKDRGEGWENLDGGLVASKLSGRKIMRIDRSGAWGARGALKFVI
jgi:hypothetical protein